MSIFGNSGIGGNTRTSDNDTTTLTNHQAGQVQNGNVSNFSAPVSFNLTNNGGKKSNATTNIQMIDAGAIRGAVDIATVGMLSAAEQGMAATAANTLVAGGAIDLAAHVVNGANDSTGKAYDYALQVADLNRNVLRDSFDFGSEAMGHVTDTASEAMFYTDSANKRSLDFGRDAFSFSRSIAQEAFDMGGYAMQQAADVARRSSDNALLQVNRANDNAQSATQAALNAAGYANQRIQEASAAALNFVDKYSRSDSSVTLESVSKWVAIAVGVVSLAWMLKGKKLA